MNIVKAHLPKRLNNPDYNYHSESTLIIIDEPLNTNELLQNQIDSLLESEGKKLAYSLYTRLPVGTLNALLKEIFRLDKNPTLLDINVTIKEKE